MIEIISFIFENSLNLFETFVLMWFIGAFNGYKHEGKKARNGYILFYLILFLSMEISDRITIFSEFLMIVMFVIMMIYAHFYLQGNRYKNALSCILIVAGEIISSTLAIFLVSSMMNISVLDLISVFSIKRVFLAIIAKMLLIYYALLMLKLKNRNLGNVPKSSWLAFLSTPVLTFITMAIIMQLSFNTNLSQKMSIYLYISFAGVIVINITSFYLFDKLNSEYENKANQMIIAECGKMQLRHYGEIKDIYSRIRVMRHDMKNNFIYIKDCLDEKKYELLYKYVISLNDQLENTRKFILTESDIFNSIVNTKLGKAFELGVDVVYSVNEGFDKIIDEFDMGIIMGNLLDNAITACEKIQDNRKMEFNIWKDDSGLHIEVQNSIEKSVLSENPNLVSTKEDIKNHGMGITSVRNIVKKYNGIMDIYEKDSLFCTNIILFDR